MSLIEVKQLRSIPYSLYYLVHILVLESILHFVPKDSLMIQGMSGLIGIVAAIAVAYLYHRTVCRITGQSA